jgi:hypothetical protein
MSHVLFLRDVLCFGSGMNADNFSFLVYVIRFLVTQNTTLNDNDYNERAMEGIGYVVICDAFQSYGRTEGRTAVDKKLGHSSLPSATILFRNFQNMSWKGYCLKQLVRS